MNKALKEDPKVKCIQQAAYESLFVGKSIVETFLQDIIDVVKLVCDLVFLQAQLAPLLVILNAHRVSGQPLDQARFVDIVHRAFALADLSQELFFLDHWPIIFVWLSGAPESLIYIVNARIVVRA